MIYKKIFLALFFFYITSFAHAGIKDTTVNGFLINVHFSLQMPFGDLADRFGNNFTLGAGTLYKFGQNWLAGVSGSFISGNQVKENGFILDLANSSGYIIGTDGFPANVELFQRGYFLSANAGKVFSFNWPNPNSGVMVLAGGGFLQHKIYINVKDSNVPQLSEEYKKGYDRLTNGFAASLFTGFLHLDNNRMINFYIGPEIVYGLTKNRRSWNFDTMKKDDVMRQDIFIGIKGGWIFPIYKKGPQRFYER